MRNKTLAESPEESGNRQSANKTSSGFLVLCPTQREFPGTKLRNQPSGQSRKRQWNNKSVNSSSLASEVMAPVAARKEQRVEISEGLHLEPGLIVAAEPVRSVEQEEGRRWTRWPLLRGHLLSAFKVAARCYL